MAGFLRPGDRKAGAFGISFDATARDDSVPVPANRHEHWGLQEQRCRLPMYQHRKELLFLVDTHATTVIVGETGSGKTTQIPQYLLESGWCAGSKSDRVCRMTCFITEHIM